ncbi:hypothetical protein JGU66_26955 [Myxococcaceae bacterium JPH2]|nr:hypothetical protein [Myxococcaceae bacterium JPH2]
MKALFVSLLLFTTGAQAESKPVKLFIDAGNPFLHVDAKDAPSVGDEVTLFADANGTKAVGTAVVMEVKGALVRLNADAVKSGAKFARAIKPAPEATPAPAAAPAAAPAQAPAPAPVAVEPPPSAPPAPPAEAAEPAPRLRGSLASGLVRVTIHNNSEEAWTGCMLRFSDERFYKLGRVSAGADDTVMKVKFSSPPVPPTDRVTVKCFQGEAEFLYAEPARPAALKGYAVGDGDRVTVFNQSDKDWTQCDVRKPDGSHYVLGNLEAGDQNSIRGGLFKKDPKPGVQWLKLICAEGELETSFK